MDGKAPKSKPAGLRERKKQETRFAIFRSAMDLFLASGFDNVSLAQVAEAANVSTVTVFNYFPAKEDLILWPMAEGVKDPGRPLRDRAPGESVLAALRRGFLDDLARREAQTGLDQDGLEFMRVIRGSSDLMARVMLLEQHRVTDLAAAIAEETGAAPGDVAPRVVAAAVIGVIGAVSAENWGRLIDGESPEAIQADAVAHAELAFAMLETGLRDYGAVPAG